jgi:phenylpropionate dioxygenase-like ring-hydroxylating dioxygenase large terminal subunit
VSAARTLPWSWYADPDVLRREQERIFRRTWQYVGHAGRIENLGDRFSAWAGEVRCSSSGTKAGRVPFSTSAATAESTRTNPAGADRRACHLAVRAHAGGGEGQAQFHFVWPNLRINVFAGAPNLSLGPRLPAGPERSTGFLDYFFAPGADPGWLDELLAFDRQVGAEDRVLVERVQRGVRSGVVQEGRLLGESEQLVVRFQELVGAALAQRFITPPETRILPG